MNITSDNFSTNLWSNQLPIKKTFGCLNILPFLDPVSLNHLKKKILQLHLGTKQINWPTLIQNDWKLYTKNRLQHRLLCPRAPCLFLRDQELTEIECSGVCSRICSQCQDHVYHNQRKTVRTTSFNKQNYIRSLLEPLSSTKELQWNKEIQAA